MKVLLIVLLFAMIADRVLADPLCGFQSVNQAHNMSWLIPTKPYFAQDGPPPAYTYDLSICTPLSAIGGGCLPGETTATGCQVGSVSPAGSLGLYPTQEIFPTENSVIFQYTSGDFDNTMRMNVVCNAAAPAIPSNWSRSTCVGPSTYCYQFTGQSSRVCQDLPSCIDPLSGVDFSFLRLPPGSSPYSSPTTVGGPVFTFNLCGTLTPLGVNCDVAHDPSSSVCYEAKNAPVCDINDMYVQKLSNGVVVYCNSATTGYSFEWTVTCNPNAPYYPQNWQPQCVCLPQNTYSFLATSSSVC